MNQSVDTAVVAAECLEKMTAALGIQTTVSGSLDGKRVVLSVKTDEPGRLIGRGGRVLNNFDYLVNRIVSGKYEQPVRVVIDVEGGANPRGGKKEGEEGKSRPDRETKADENDVVSRQPDNDRLEKLALDAAKEVKRWGDPKTIGPFTASERRVIHAALASDTTIQTQSGDVMAGNKKKITISLATAE
ncbi:MAG: KH domain-containing protein [Lentisphaeria bacterium]|nr:KH domain-containing protein [Lentisphaeria bacterium]